MTDPLPERLLELAERVEAATGPNFQLEQEIGAAVFPKRTDPYPPYTASIDAAMTLAEDFILVALSDIAAGLTGCCLCSDTTTNPPTEHWGIPREVGPREQVLARAVVAAALRAQSQRGDRQG
jgi:hypothetical protein